MALEVDVLQLTSADVLKTQLTVNAIHDGGAAAQESPEADIAWEIIKEECHDVLEQLPLTLQRNFKLMRDLDEQVAAHLHAIPPVLQEYLQLRVKLAQDVDMSDVKVPNDEFEPADDAVHHKRPVSRASFSSASLTPISESPSTRSTSLPNSRLNQDDATNTLDEDEETEEHDTSFESQLPPLEPLTSTQLIARVATLATDAVRGSLEKVNLANAAYAAIDRHVRALDLAIEEQEKAIATGIRPGTRPSALVTTSPTHSVSHSVESAKLFALAEVASAMQAGKETLHSLQQPPSTIDTNAKPFDAKIKITETKKSVKRANTTQKSQQIRRDRRVKDAAGQGEAEQDVDNTKYCYCNDVSYGDMIACDGPSCKREWFHYECVGIKRPPPHNAKWYCRDCVGKVEPAKKKRKR